MKWLVDKVDTSDMTARFKSRRKKNNEIAYTMILSKNFKEYIKEEGYTSIRFGHDKVDNENKLVLGLGKENLGVNVINNKDEVRSWFEVNSYIEQYHKEEIEIDLLKDYKVSIRKNGTLILDLVSE